MKKQFVALVSRSLFVLLLTCTPAGAENTPNAPQLQKIKHTVLSPTSEQVVLQLNGSYSPKVSTLKDENPRLYFDFDGMAYGRDIKSVTVTNGSIIKRIRVGRHEGESPKTRIVFDVATFKGLSYTQEFDEGSSSLVVRFTESGKAATTVPAKKTAAATDTPEKSPDTAPPRAKWTGSVPGGAEKTPVAASNQQAQTAEPLSTPAPGEKTAAQPAVKAAPEATRQPEPEQAGPPPSLVTPAPGASIAENAAKPGEKEATAAPAPGNKKEEKTKSADSPLAATQKADAATPDPGKPEETAKPAALVKTTDKPQLEYVKFDDSSPKGEMVMFKLNGFHPPAVHGVEEGTPKVICDFNNTKLMQTVKGPLKTNGKFVKVIRTTATKKPEKVRVVIDLEPNRSYDLQQVFFKEDNLFVLFVNTVKK
ncbi:MAG: AMIN domain-containing protein [Desulfobulbus sp.]|nr:AMIN domain-containing protein [Desulfobulbus sp.]